MKNLKSALLLLLIAGLFSCAGRVPVKEAEQLPFPSIEIPGDDFLTIVAVGDNLYHSAMIHEGEEGDYENAYSEIRQMVKAADIAFINQETLLAGADFGFSGYPRFNTPQELGRAIYLTGFNVINHATNHIMDKGEKAVFATLDFWDTIPGTRILGVHRNEEQRRLPVLIQKNNITVGFLSYTYGTNGIPLPKDKPFLVSLADKETMAKEIDALRPLCEFLVVSMHWGEEYRYNYNNTQKDLAVFLAEHGVDLVLGHHPHVIQPIEYIARADGKTMLCYYSLGNFISGQTRPQTVMGAMAYIKLAKNYRGNAGSVFIAEAGSIPLVIHYEKNFTEFKVYPLFSYTEEMAAKHMLNQQNSEITIDTLQDLSAGIFGNKELFDNPFAAIMPW